MMMRTMQEYPERANMETDDGRPPHGVDHSSPTRFASLECGVDAEAPAADELQPDQPLPSGCGKSDGAVTATDGMEDAGHRRADPSARRFDNHGLMLFPASSDPPYPVGMYCCLDLPPLDPPERIGIGHRYEFTREDTELCVAAGIIRRRACVEHKAGNANFSGRDDEQVSIQGMFGEYALCRMFRLAVEIFDSAPRTAKTEKRFDCVFELPDGTQATVDVKTTFRDKAHMLVGCGKMENPPTLYAFMIWCVKPDGPDGAVTRAPPIHFGMRSPVLSFRGFALPKWVSQSRHLIRTREGSNQYGVPQNELLTFEEVMSADAMSMHLQRAAAASAVCGNRAARENGGAREESAATT